MVISSSDIILYDTCPRKWQIIKESGGKRRQTFASYRFGSALHHAAKKFATEMEDPVDVFRQYWDKYLGNAMELSYEPGKDWTLFSMLGEKFMGSLSLQFPEKGINPILAESRIKVALGENVLLSVQPDLIGDSASSYVVVDYKTSEKKISDAWVAQSDQLTSYALGAQEQFSSSADVAVIICNFVMQSQTVEWIESKRTAYAVKQYEEKVLHIVKLMEGTLHLRRPLDPHSSPCNTCDFTEKC
jgi:CRISPR/Cas system-associated exonuclease Cas4 (RecB family)